MTAQDKALKENTASAPLQIVAPGTCVETGEQAALVLGMYDHLVETIHQYNPSADFAQIDKAFRYADTHHNGQLRKDGSPFITHPLAVAQIIAEELRLDSESIEAALMHDCIEDTSATYAEIAKEFSPAVADLVEGVSKLTRVQYASKEEEQMENLRKMLMAMAKDIRVILIKLADRTHNMRTMEYQTAEKQRQKSLETMEIYAPIAHRLGMQRIKWELEDLSLKYLDPVGYDEITRSLAAKEAEHEAFMDRVQAQIEERLKEQHVPYLKVYGRMKHPYSIYRKMYAQNKTMDEVLDLFAFRVIVDTVADCYNVLGIIHDLYRPILGRFKDYIGTPKPNMYQSLHTTVIGADGIPFEVQIRTEEMHEIAEYGVAAHWKYKSGETSSESIDSKLQWVSRLFEIEDDTQDPDEFMDAFKIDIFRDEVFVFTPKGDVIVLPQGATMIDFAYAIHSGVGNKMVGAKVNGMIVPIDREPQTGDIIEVLTSSASKGPSRDWLNIVKTGDAKNKIRQWFKKEKREENIEQGLELIKDEAKRLGYAPKSLLKEGRLQQVADKLNILSEEDLLAALGYGGITVRSVMTKLIELYKKDLKEATPPDVSKMLSELKTPQHVGKRNRSSHGVLVEGESGLLVRLARCCNPIPGDPITGFVTKGRGVSVHRADCPNVLRDNDLSRMIEVSWDIGLDKDYTVEIEIVCNDKSGVLAELLAVPSEMKINIHSVNANPNRSNKTSTIIMGLDVKNAAQVSQIMTKMRRLKNVYSVSRALSSRTGQ